MSKEKVKKREIDELYSSVLLTMHRQVKQIAEIYDVDFDTVMSHIESVEHGP